MSKNNNFLVGLVTVVLTVCLLMLILWKNNTFKKISSYELIGEFNSINGLLNNAVVKYRGYPVGRVTLIRPYPTMIEVTFYVNDDFNIPTDSTVKVIFDGLVGEKYLEIIPNPNSSQMCANGDRLVGYATSGLSDFIDVGTQN